MLSAFQAQPIHELKPRDKSKIESLLTYGDRLLVGLNTGALRIYRVNEPSQQSADATEPAEQNGSPTQPQSSPSKSPKSKEKVVELLREEEKFSKRPVQQLAIIKEVNVLVSLSDGYVSLHDLQSYQLVEKLEKTKGATTFTVTSNVVKDSETGVPTLVSRLAVGVKRRVLCWMWQDMEQLPNVTEIAVEASVKCLNWVSGTKLVVGMDPGFSLVDIETLEITQINKPDARTTSGSSDKDNVGTAELAGIRFGAVSSSGMGYMGMGSWVPKPMITPLSSNDNEVLLAKDVNTLFISATDGKAVEKRQVPWSSAPEAIGYSYPYLLALQAPEKGTLQIRNPDTLSLLQTIAVPGATILHVPPPNISLAHAGKRFLVASERTIWRMNALSYDDALAELVEKERFDEAISLLTLLEDTLIEDKLDRIREIKMLKATSLFKDRRYRDSLDLFTEAEAPPVRVVALYPPEIAGDVSSLPPKNEETVATSQDSAGEDDGNAIVKEPPSTPAKGLLGRVTGGHARKDSDSDSIKSTSRAEAASPSPHKRTPSKNLPAPTSAPAVEKDKALEGEDLKLAVRCLTSFLAQARVKIQRYLNSDGSLKDDPPFLDKETARPEFANLLPQSLFSDQKGGVIDYQAELFKCAQLVYTTLFRAYMLVSPSLAGSLFRIDNFCDPEVVQNALYANRRYHELIEFLHGKGLHRQALDILTRFGKGEVDSKADGADPAEEEEVGDHADMDIPDGFRGPERTVVYLKQLPPELIDLVLEYAAWPLKAAPEAGMDIFLADTDFAERLPRERVRKFLEGIDEKLEVQYLEHVINELGDQTPEFHQRLIEAYIDELKSVDSGENQQEAVKVRLETFLKKSREYNKAKTLKLLPSDDAAFFESRAIVLSAMGNHKQALSIYVFQLKDFDKAEAYCNKVYQAEIEAEQQQQKQLLQKPAYSRTSSAMTNGDYSDSKPPLNRAHTEVSKAQPNIFATLLGLYLRPPSGEEKRWSQALDLLSRHGARLPASSTLEFMPDDLAVQELQNYFRGRLRHATSLNRQERIIKSLEGVKLANAEYHLLFGPDADIEKGRLGGRSRRARIVEEDHCRICHRRFGASAVKVFPDGEVVHYGCAGKREKEGGVKSAGRGWG